MLFNGFRGQHGEIVASTFIRLSRNYLSVVGDNLQDLVRMAPGCYLAENI